MLDTTTLLVLIVGVALMSPLIELLGPPGNNRAKRQIGTILSTALAFLVATLEANGVNVDTESLTQFVMSAVLAKAGGQALHDGYWTDKNLPTIRTGGDV